MRTLKQKSKLQKQRERFKQNFPIGYSARSVPCFYATKIFPTKQRDIIFLERILCLEKTWASNFYPPGDGCSGIFYAVFDQFQQIKKRADPFRAHPFFILL
jgi:hypothetical protein